MKKITNSFKQIVDPAVPRGSVYLIGGQQFGKSKKSEAYRKMWNQIDLEIRQTAVRIRHSWLYFPDDRTEVERICNGIDMGVRPARSTLDNWQYKCLTDNTRSSMGLGEN